MLIAPKFVSLTLISPSNSTPVKPTACLVSPPGCLSSFDPCVISVPHLTLWHHYPSTQLLKPKTCMFFDSFLLPAPYPIQKQTLTFMPPQHISDPPTSLSAALTVSVYDTIFSHLCYCNELTPISLLHTEA